MLSIKNLTKEFDRNGQKFGAVNNVSLDVAKSEFAIMIGHSGSGKTTLFNMLSGMIRPTSGEIIVDSENIVQKTDSQLAEYRNKTIGYVLQGQSILNNFKVIENVCLPAYLGKADEALRERGMMLLEKVGLEKLAEEYPHNLSGGELRRLAIIRGMINEPEILIADEPTSSLDPENSEIVMGLLKSFCK